MAYPLRQSPALFLRVFEPLRRIGRQGPPTAFDLLNPRFSLHVVDALRNGEMHFNEMARQIRVSANTLRGRLRVMESEGIVIRTVLSAMPPSVTYRLTDKGESLAKILDRIRQWEHDWLGRKPVGPYAAVHLEAAETRKPYGKARK